MLIDNLVIETTRRCNMSCDHCLRGPAQNLDMSPIYIEKMFSLITHVREITLTGGEPSLNPSCVEQIVFLARKNNVSIDNFFFYTNQLFHDKTLDFQAAILKLYDFCEDNEHSGIGLSNDECHVAHWTTKLADYSWFRNTFKQHEKDGAYMRNPINEGNQKENFDRGKEADCEIDPDSPLIYLNCNGYIISNCDFSYKRQATDNNIIIGHVREITDLEEAILYKLSII